MPKVYLCTNQNTIVFIMGYTSSYRDENVENKIFIEIDFRHDSFATFTRGVALRMSDVGKIWGGNLFVARRGTGVIVVVRYPKMLPRSSEGMLTNYRWK
jgi:hypothetical protein